MFPSRIFLLLILRRLSQCSASDARLVWHLERRYFSVTFFLERHELFSVLLIYRSGASTHLVELLNPFIICCPFALQKTAVAVTHCRAGKGHIRLNG